MNSISDWIPGLVMSLGVVIRLCIGVLVFASLIITLGDIERGAGGEWFVPALVVAVFVASLVGAWLSLAFNEEVTKNVPEEALPSVILSEAVKDVSVVLLAVGAVQVVMPAVYVLASSFNALTKDVPWLERIVEMFTNETFLTEGFRLLFFGLIVAVCWVALVQIRKFQEKNGKS